MSELESDQLRLIDLVLDQDQMLHELHSKVTRLEDRMLQLLGLLTK